MMRLVSEDAMMRLVSEDAMMRLVSEDAMMRLVSEDAKHVTCFRRCNTCDLFQKMQHM